MIPGMVLPLLIGFNKCPRRFCALSRARFIQRFIGLKRAAGSKRNGALRTTIGKRAITNLLLLGESNSRPNGSIGCASLKGLISSFRKPDIMPNLRPWFSRLFGLFHKNSRDAEMAEELRAHVDFLTERNIAAGMSPHEAHNAALRQFGGVEQIKELAREQRVWRWADEFVQDIRFGA